MSTPTTPVIPTGWSDDGTTLTAPDATTSTGATRTQIVTVDPTDLATAQASIATLNTQVADLQAEVAKLQGAPTPPVDDDSSEDTSIAALTARITTLEATVTALQAQVTALPGASPADDDSSEDARLTALESAVAALQAQLGGEGRTVLGELETDINTDINPTPVTSPSPGA